MESMFVAACVVSAFALYFLMHSVEPPAVQSKGPLPKSAVEEARADVDILRFEEDEISEESLPQKRPRECPEVEEKPKFLNLTRERLPKRSLKTQNELVLEFLKIRKHIQSKPKDEAEDEEVDILDTNKKPIVDCNGLFGKTLPKTRVLD